jgi:hypothetical protein
MVVGLVLFQNHWNVLKVVLINPEALWPASRSKRRVLLAIESDCQDILSLTKILLVRPPNLSSCLVLSHFLPLCQIDFGVVKHVETNVSGESGIA